MKGMIFMISFAALEKCYGEDILAEFSDEHEGDFRYERTPDGKYYSLYFAITDENEKAMDDLNDRIRAKLIADGSEDNPDGALINDQVMITRLTGVSQKVVDDFLNNYEEHYELLGSEIMDVFGTYRERNPLAEILAQMEQESQDND